ncbi:MAG: hypothetical protein RBT86_00585 [Azospira sp.]|jgi:hypothetical protein|nr:hypothetical protein [Azospira sp.]
MAIGWMTILSNVPWSDVIRNAPAVAEGAKKLWKKVGSNAGKGNVVDGGSPEERIAALHARVDELQAQMLASSEVIQSLAEQNAQLIARIESGRRRLALLVLLNLLVVGIALAVLLRA